jgi:protocatechuate 3,4-dioxygenase beta subunit
MGTTTTDINGHWTVRDLPPGKHYVRVRNLPWFAPLSTAVTSFADDDVDNDDNGAQVSTDPIYSPVITLTALGEPGVNPNENKTIDFGINGYPVGGIVTSVNDDSIPVFDPDTGKLCTMLVDPFGTSHNRGDRVTSDVPNAIELGPDGFLYVGYLNQGNVRRISPGGADLGNFLSTLPGIASIAAVTFGGDGSIFVIDDAAQRIVRFHGPLSPTPGQPIGTSPYTFISSRARDIATGPDGNLYLLVVSASGAHSIVRYDSTTGAELNTITTETQLVGVVAGGSARPVITGMDIENNMLYGINQTDGEVFKVDLTLPGTPAPPLLVSKLDNANKGTFETGDIELNPVNRQLYIVGYKWNKPLNDGSTFQTAAFINVEPSGAPNAIANIYEVPMPTPPGPNDETWPGPRDLNFASFTCVHAPITSIGNLVWNDLDGDAVLDPTEDGISGVKVQLYRDSNNNVSDGAETLVGWTFTDISGHYHFNGLPPSTYQIIIPSTNFDPGGSLFGYGASSPIDSAVDNQVDGNDNGIQWNGSFTAVSSPLITLTVGGEPTGNGLSGTESKLGGDLDDALGDSSGDMTVDFGFVVPGPGGIGNLVFEDLNGNGIAEPSEGVDGVTVQLYASGSLPGIDSPVARRTTSGGGYYSFRGLVERDYFVHIPASQFGSSGRLRGLSPHNAVVPGDDDAGQNGIHTDNPDVKGVSSGIISIMENGQPTALDGETGLGAEVDDLSGDDDQDLTVDFGFYRRAGLGNFVYFDADNNGSASVSEGINGITVELYDALEDPSTGNFLRSTQTANGLYNFKDLTEGVYRVHIPASMFLPGAPLYGKVSIAEGKLGDDDVGEDGLNEFEPTVNGVTSDYIILSPGHAPTDFNFETGIDRTSDNAIDAAFDLTIDFGFQVPLGVGNAVFIDANGNGTYDAGEGAQDVTLELYRSTDIPGYNLPQAAQTTDADGHYLFDRVTGGSYFIHIPYYNFSGGALDGHVSIPGVEANTTADDSVGENGVDSASPLYAGISSGVFTLSNGAQPRDSAAGALTGENGFLADEDNDNDSNTDLTVDFGFVPPDPNALGVGNLVYSDADGNRRADPGEGVSGVLVQLFPFTVTTPASTTPLASVTTSSEGTYYFGDLAPGNYFVYLPASNFASTGKLARTRPMSGQSGDDQQDDGELAADNGDDAANPSVTGIRSNVFNLSPGNEPGFDDSEWGLASYMDDSIDTNVDLTIDFGFFTPMGVGNMVFNDNNGNGVADLGEGVAGVTVELWSADSNTALAFTTTSSDSQTRGRYFFNNVNPGIYFLRIPASQFNLPTSPLYNKLSLRGSKAEGDDSVGEDGLDESDELTAGVSTTVFDLRPGTAPSGVSAITGEPGLFGSDDNGINGLVDVNVDLTRDFGFTGRMPIGNLVFNDYNGNGKFDPATEAGVQGVTVILRRQPVDGSATTVGSTVTDTHGRYSFSVTPGSYFVSIPPEMFQETGPLYQTFSSAVANRIEVGGSTNAAKGTTANIFTDDDMAEDGIDDTSPEVNGIRTPTFIVALGQQPTGANTETGFEAAADDSADSDGTLTIDFGFTPNPVCVGNLVFRDTNNNGVFDAGIDQGLTGVKVQLYQAGQDPANEEPRAQSVSQTNGYYLLCVSPPGDYFVHIPPSEFQPGGPLYQNVPVEGFGIDNGVDDNLDENTLPSESPTTNGVNSIQFSLGYEAEPVTGETGFSPDSDDGPDGDSDLTIDLGFVGSTVAPPSLSIGNVVFKDLNGDGVFTQGEGVDGVWMLLYTASATPGSTNPIASTLTSNGGQYLFTGLLPGSYVVHVAADNFKSAISINGGPVTAGPLYNQLSITGAGQTDADLDDHVDEDGRDVLNPEQVGITSRSILLSIGGEPTTASGEVGAFAQSDSAADANANLTVDFGFAARMAVGNLVFKDANLDGIYSAGADTGVSGVTVQLFRSGDNPATATPIDSIITDSSGRYGFIATPGNYFIHIPAPMFAANSVLGNFLPSANLGSQGDDNVGHDATAAANPASTGVVSRTFSLTPGLAPATTQGNEGGAFGSSDDGPLDGFSDLTVDLAFAPKPLSAGNLVFADNNSNGRYDAGDAPLPGVKVELLLADLDPTIATSPRLSTTTGANGTWQISVYQPGSYIAYVPASQFQPGGPLEGRVSSPSVGTVLGADDNQDEDGIDVPHAVTSGVASASFTLTYGAAPVSTETETGFQNTTDIGEDNNANLTVDFGFSQGVGVGNLVFRDTNNNGRYDSSADTPLVGVAMHLYAAATPPGTGQPLATTVTDTLGLYRFTSLQPGSYIVHIPATAMLSSTLKNLISSTATASGDDNVGENGLDTTIPISEGILSNTLTLALGTAPTNSLETGFYGTADDDIGEANIDFTVDFGLRLSARNAPIAPIAGRVVNDTNNNGSLDLADTPLPGVELTLYADIDADGLLDNNEMAALAVTITDQNGAYRFAPRSGVYLVVSTPLPGATPTYDTDGGNLVCTCVTVANTAVSGIDFAQALSPSTFAQWQAQNPLNGQNGPSSNPDMDGLANLVEYALGTAANSGLQPFTVFRLEENAQGGVDAVAIRRTAPRGDVTLRVQGSVHPTTAAAWTALTTPSTITPLDGGLEEVRFANVHTASTFSGLTQGCVRLRVSLDADLNGTPEATAHSETQVFAILRFPPGQSTFSQPLVKPDLYTGVITSVTADGLTIALPDTREDISSHLAGRPYYAHILTGAHAGQRLEMDEAQCSRSRLHVLPGHALSTLTTLPSTLSGARIAVRSHYTLSQLMPAYTFTAARSPSSADRIIFFANNSFSSHWLTAGTTGAKHWSLNSDATLADTGSRVVPPGEAMLLHVRSASATRVITGTYRTAPLTLKVSAASQFIGTGAIAAQSPGSLRYTTGTGFTSGDTSAQADRLRLWQGDATVGATGYMNYFLHSSGHWVQESDAGLVSQDAAPFLQAFRGIFLVSKTARLVSQ